MINLISILALLVSSYIYNPHDWLKIPALKDARNVTADPFYVYIIYDDGITLLNKSDRKMVRTITEADGIPQGIKLGAYDPETGVLWLLTTHLLVSFNPQGRAVYTFTHSMTNATALGVGLKFIYLATDEEVIKFSKLTHEFETADTIPPQVIWFGTRSPYKPRNYIFLTPYFYLDKNLRRYDIVAAYEDNNTLWVTTDGFGVFAYDLFSKVPKHYLFGPASSKVLKIFSDPTGLWFTNPDYISFYNPKADTWSYYDLSVRPLSSLQISLIKPAVYDLIRRGDLFSAVWKDSLYWLGTRNGLYSFEPKSEILSLELASSVGIRKFLMKGDSVFLATDQGLFLFSKKDRTAAEIKDPFGKLGFGVYDAAETKGKLFFACSGGLVSLDSSGDWEFRQIPGIDLTDHPTALAGSGDFLFVAASSGLIVYDEEKRDYQRLEPSAGLPLDNINALAADKDYLWIGTNTGIARFSYKVLFPYRR